MFLNVSKLSNLYFGPHVVVAACGVFSHVGYFIREHHTQSLRIIQVLLASPVLLASYLIIGQGVPASKAAKLVSLLLASAVLD